MKVLLTGASSFTGFWFAKAMVADGHEVVATFQGEQDAYRDLRGTRVADLVKICTPIFNCRFGSPRFFDVVDSSSHWDALCHHAADVTDYHSERFDFAAAVANNTYEVSQVTERLSDRNCGRFVITGSIFEGGEGAGSDDLAAFSPYGLSKELTARVFTYFVHKIGARLGKFVIPNPFGPFEEARFTAYLIRTWARGETAGVRTPDYVRDNIHVDLLAKAYSKFISEIPEEKGISRLSPSGYVENQGTFATRFANAMGPRLNLDCSLKLASQTDFDEPRIRINTDSAIAMIESWSEQDAWDAMAEYYQQQVIEIRKEL